MTFRSQLPCVVVPVVAIHNKIKSKVLCVQTLEIPLIFTEKLTAQDLVDIHTAWHTQQRRSASQPDPIHAILETTSQSSKIITSGSMSEPAVQEHA